MDQAALLLRADRCSLYLVDDVAGQLCTVFAQGGGGDESSSGGSLQESEKPPKKQLVIRLPLGKGIAGACAEEGREIILDDVQNDPRFDKQNDLKSNYVTKTAICMPIKNSA